MAVRTASARSLRDVTPASDQVDLGRNGRRTVLATIVALSALVFLPTTALAHAGLVSATPEPGSELGIAPAVVNLHFSEPLNARLSGAIVTAPDGQRTAGRPAGRCRRDLRPTVGECPWRLSGLVEVRQPAGRPLALGILRVRSWRNSSVRSHRVLFLATDNGPGDLDRSLDRGPRPDPRGRAPAVRPTRPSESRARVDPRAGPRAARRREWVAHLSCSPPPGTLPRRARAYGA